MQKIIDPQTQKERLATPVLFIIFNRPDTTQKVFDEIRKAKPKYLYVAADGPRESREHDKQLCEETRAIVNQVDWDCEVKTLFQNKNLGCKMGVSSAINWFFENVEAGIILEDDCVPHQSFFRFTSEMLEKYKNEKRVMMITGFNPITKYRSPFSYYFSRYFSIWGWATWRRAWRKYDVTMSEWPQLKTAGLDKYYTDPYAAKYMGQAFENTYLGKIDTWDYQWSLAGLQNNGLSIVPSQNLISNIGLNGVHFSGPATKNQKLLTFDLYENELLPTQLIERDVLFDSIYSKKTFHIKLLARIREFLAKSRTLKKFYLWLKNKNERLLVYFFHNKQVSHVIENVNKTTYDKNCLLVYMVEPFVNPETSLSHQNYWQSKELANVIGEFGYNVDVIQYNDTQSQLLKKYDLVIDLHPGMNTGYIKNLKNNAKRVAYITGQNPSFSNCAERERVHDVYQRRGVRLQLRRQAKLFKRQILSSFDAMFFIGNKYNLRTYEGYTPPLVSFINNNGYDFLANHDHSERSPKNFLFLASNGQVHKGLDLLLEVFARNPDLQLYVCSQFQNESDFCGVYKKELYECPNIFPIGFVDIGSDVFRNITKKCTYVIMPSCSEARAGSILTGMSAGLIPVVSRDCGFDDNEAVQLVDCSHKTIEQTIIEYSQKTKEWREREAERIMNIISTNYSKNNFSNSVRSAMKSLLK